MQEALSEFLSRTLVCPRDRLPLTANGSLLLCPVGHRYPIVHGVPVLLLDDREQTIGIAAESLAEASRVAKGGVPADPYFTSTLGINDVERQGIIAEGQKTNSHIDPVAKFMIGATNGILYRDLIGKIKEYTIPELRLPPGEGKRLLDIGCNWGRWCVAAARLRYRPIGLDPSLGAVLAARRVAEQLGLQVEFVVGDARFLPFTDSTFDVVFSYSVIQHFDKGAARESIAEIGRVLRPEGRSLIQMPNKLGLRCLFHQARRRFREPVNFEVRYWTIPELRNVFSYGIGPCQFSVDCFFGIGLQAADSHLMSLGRRWLIRCSELLRRFTKRLGIMTYFADSLYVTSTKEAKPKLP
jgi:SAM-dependent methyltransferase